MLDAAIFILTVAENFFEVMSKFSYALRQAVQAAKTWREVCNEKEFD